MAFAEGLAVALLAAGRSTRFGETDKLSAPLGGRSLIEWAAQAGRSIIAPHHFLVAGPDTSFDAERLGYQLLANPHPEQGMASSLRIAAAAAEQAGAAALLVLLADVPFIDTGHLAVLIRAFRENDARPIFSSAPGGPPQPPALFPRGLFPALQALEGDKGARGLAGDALCIETSSTSLLDIDTPEDLAQARALNVSPNISRTFEPRS